MKVVIFVPRIVAMVYVMSKYKLLSLQIIAIDLYFNLTLIFKYNSGRLSFFYITSKLLSSTQKYNT